MCMSSFVLEVTPCSDFVLYYILLSDENSLPYLLISFKMLLIIFIHLFFQTNFILILQNTSKHLVGLLTGIALKECEESGILYISNFSIWKQKYFSYKTNQIISQKISKVYHLLNLYIFGSYLRRTYLNIIIGYYWYTGILLIFACLSCIRRDRRLSMNINRPLMNFFGFSKYTVVYPL